MYRSKVHHLVQHTIDLMPREQFGLLLISNQPEPEENPEPVEEVKAPAPEPIRFIGYTEVTRSFSYKLNLGRIDPTRQYESVDFFMAQKATVEHADAERTAETIYGYCKTQVMKDARAYQADMQAAIRSVEEKRVAKYGYANPPANSRNFAKFQTGQK